MAPKPAWVTEITGVSGVSVRAKTPGVAGIIPCPWARTATPRTSRIAACSSGEGAPGVRVHSATHDRSASEIEKSPRDTLELKGDCKPLSMCDIHQTSCLHRPRARTRPVHLKRRVWPCVGRARRAASSFAAPNGRSNTAHACNKRHARAFEKHERNQFCGTRVTQVEHYDHWGPTHAIGPVWAVSERVLAARC